MIYSSIVSVAFYADRQQLDGGILSSVWFNKMKELQLVWTLLLSSNCKNHNQQNLHKDKGKCVYRYQVSDL